MPSPYALSSHDAVTLVARALHSLLYPSPPASTNSSSHALKQTQQRNISPQQQSISPQQERQQQKRVQQQAGQQQEGEGGAFQQLELPVLPSLPNGTQDALAPPLTRLQQSASMLCLTRTPCSIRAACPMRLASAPCLLHPGIIPIIPIILEQSRVGQSRVEQSRVEQSRVEQSRVEQSRVEQSRVEQSREEQSRVEQNTVEQSRVEQSRVEQSRVEQSRVEQSRVEQSRVEQSRVEQSRVEQSRVEQSRVEQSRVLTPHGDLAASEIRIFNIQKRAPMEVALWSSSLGLVPSSSRPPPQSAPPSTASPAPRPGPVAVPSTQVGGKGGGSPTGSFPKTRLRIAVPNKQQYKEYVNVSDALGEGNSRFSGYCVEVFRLAVTRLPYKLDYEFVLYGDKDLSYTQMVLAVANKDLSYTQMVLAVANKVRLFLSSACPLLPYVSLCSFVFPCPFLCWPGLTYDAAVGGITVLDSRSKVVFFTYPIHVKEVNSETSQRFTSFRACCHPVLPPRAATPCMCTYPIQFLTHHHSLIAALPSLSLSQQSGLGVMGYSRPYSNPWMVFSPFTASLWAVTAAICLTTGLLAMMLDRQRTPDFQGTLQKRLMTAVWYGCHTFYSIPENILVYQQAVALSRHMSDLYAPLYAPLYTPLYAPLYAPLILPAEYRDIYSALTSNSPIGYQQHAQFLARLIPHSYASLAPSTLHPTRTSILPSPAIPPSATRNTALPFSAFHLCALHPPPSTPQDIYSALTSNSPIGYQQGSFVHTYLLQLGVAPAKLVSLAGESEYASSLTSGRVTVIVDENPYLNLFPTARQAGITSWGEPVCIFPHLGASHSDSGREPLPQPLLLFLVFTLSPGWQDKLVSLAGESEYASSLASGRVTVIVDEDPYLNLFSAAFCDGVQAPQPFSILNLAFVGADISQAILELAMKGELERLKEQYLQVGAKEEYEDWLTRYLQKDSLCSNGQASSAVLTEKDNMCVDDQTASAVLTEVNVQKFTALLILYLVVSLLCCAAYVGLLIYHGYRYHHHRHEEEEEDEEEDEEAADQQLLWQQQCFGLSCGPGGNTGASYKTGKGGKNRPDIHDNGGFEGGRDTYGRASVGNEEGGGSIEGYVDAGPGPSSNPFSHVPASSTTSDGVTASCLGGPVWPDPSIALGSAACVGMSGKGSKRPEVLEPLLEEGSEEGGIWEEVQEEERDGDLGISGNKDAAQRGAAAIVEKDVVVGSDSAITTTTAAAAAASAAAAAAAAANTAPAAAAAAKLSAEIVFQSTAVVDLPPPSSINPFPSPLFSADSGREWSRERYLDPKNIQRQQAYSAASLLPDFSSPGNSARKRSSPSARSSGMFASAGSASASASASAAAFPEPASSARHRRRPSWGSIQASPAFPSNRPSTASGSFFHAASASGASSAGSAASAGDADACLATASPSNHPYHSSSGLSLAADPPPARLSTASDVFFHAPRAGDSPADGVTSASAFLSGTNFHHSPSSGSMYPARSFGGSDAAGHADMPKRERRTSSILPSSSSLPAEPCPPEAEACALDAVAQLGEPKRRSFTSGMEEQSDSSTRSPLTLSLSSPDEQPQQQQQPQHLLLRQQLPPKASYGRLNSPHVNSQATSSQASQEQQQQQRNQAGRLRKTARVHRRSASYDVTQKPEMSIKGELGKNLANLDKVLSPGSTFDADANVQPEYKGVQRVRAFRLSKSPQRQPNP
ncbi:unnamed protein product [Closterium sp. Naga37s-1]|nr:unnamed protein product [Closterium sp. Naga37s-1]